MPTVMMGRIRRAAARSAVLAVVSTALIVAPVRAVTTAEPFDVHGDGYADLATGVPGESVGRVEGAGAIELIYGSADGLIATGAQLWSRASPGVDGEPTAHEGLVVGDPEGDLLWSDCQHRSRWAEGRGPGNVYLLYGTDHELSRARRQVWSHRTPGVPGIAKPLEGFGGGGVQLLDVGRGNGVDLLIHSPDDRSRRGSVTTLHGTRKGLTRAGARLWHQDVPGIPGHGERNDSFGQAS